MERDRNTKARALILTISTHTLTWSVTQSVINPPTLETNFNSHAHVERDTALQAADVASDNFNSHAHVERDRIIFYGVIF